MTGSVGYRTLKFREVLTEKFKQYYPQTLELTSVYNDVYNGGSLNVSAKWELKKRPEKIYAIMTTNIQLKGMD